jgi:hypothetical protein
MSENSQRFNLNKIIDDANKSLSVALEPISKEIEMNFEIANKLNKFIEDIPIYKNLNNKYNDILNENVALKEKLNKFENIFISLSKQNKELDNSNKTLIEKITANNNNNNRFWYENKYFDCRKNSIQLKIIDDKSNDKSNDMQEIYSIYCSNGLSYNNMNVKQSNSDIEEIYDIEEKIKEDEEEEEEEDEEEEEEEDEEEEEEEDEEEEEEEDDDEEEEEDDDEEEEEEEDEEEDDCQDVFEIIINKKRYYVTDEKNGIIYEIIENDEVGKKIGMLKDKVLFFISV